MAIKTIILVRWKTISHPLLYNNMPNVIIPINKGIVSKPFFTIPLNNFYSLITSFPYNLSNNIRMKPVWMLLRVRTVRRGWWQEVICVLIPQRTPADILTPLFTASLTRGLVDLKSSDCKYTSIKWISETSVLHCSLMKKKQRAEVCSNQWSYDNHWSKKVFVAVQNSLKFCDKNSSKGCCTVPDIERLSSYANTF